MSPPSLLLAAAAQGQNPLLAWVPMILIFGIMYVLLFLPMRRRQKALQKLIENLKRGDKVITSGGLVGEIAEVEPKFIHLKVAPNVKLKIAKSAVAGLESDPAAAESKP
jgi:preprotein translocase subunit YajC